MIGSTISECPSQLLISYALSYPENWHYNEKSCACWEEGCYHAVVYLATNTDYRTIVCVVLKEVCAAIVDVLMPRCVRIPTGHDLRTLMFWCLGVFVFQQVTIKNSCRWIQERDFGFPQCAGMVDGTHIPIVSPEYCPADYYNRKGWHSIILQGTVDNVGKFTNINIGWPGRVSPRHNCMGSLLTFEWYIYT